MSFIKHKVAKKTTSTRLALITVLAAFFVGILGSAAYGGVSPVAADTTTNGSGNTSTTGASTTTAPQGFGNPNSIQGGSQCGSGDSAVKISIDIGCKGALCHAKNAQEGCNPILDATFAILKLISDGVGLLVIGSIVFAGIQYSSSRGDPGKTKEAIARIRNTLIALLVYIFAYAILNYVLPAGFFAG